MNKKELFRLMDGELIDQVPVSFWHHFFDKDTRERYENEPLLDEFFEFNPGTKKMYRKNFDIVAVFKLVKGEGEMFHLYAEEKIRRLRFAFGGMEKLPMNHTITDACTGCGSCMENCVEEAIYKGEDGKCHIRYMDCNDCGICYTKCPLAGTAMISRLAD